MYRWLLLTVFLSTVLWVAASYFIAEQFLTLGIKDYVAEDEQRLIEALPIDGLEKKSIQIQGIGAQLSASWFENSFSGDCAVILLPGIGGYRTQVLPALPLFYDLGCHVMAYDPRGTGDSARVIRTFGHLEKKDNAHVIQWIHRETGLPYSRIGVWGPSFGAAVGILTLDEISNIGFVIADSTYSTFDRVAFDSISLAIHPAAAHLFTPSVLKILALRTGVSVREISPQQTLSNNLKTPVLLVHAVRDPAMNVAHSKRVFATRAGNNIYLELTDWGAGHADSALVAPEKYAQLIHRFLSQVGFLKR